MVAGLAVKPVTVGPIVGHTTDTTVRLWGRGAPPPAGQGPYCYGVVQLLEAGSTTPAQGLYFRLLPEDDFTGSIDLGSLEPGRPYAYRMGYFHSNVEQHLLLPVIGLELQGASSGVLRTARTPGPGELSLLFGSCRHPVPRLDELVSIGLADRGDRTFRTMLDQVEAGMPTDLLLMVGDQIYADVAASDKTFAQYCANYQRSFTQPSLRTLMARLPTYMALDDHEIADNWSMDRLNDPKLSPKQVSANKARLMAALQAFRCYQVVHGPALERKNEPGATNALLRYWYTFQCGPARFFVMDVRTERYHRAQPPEMISAEQLKALQQWMKQEVGGLKFVVSPVPLFPDLKLSGWAMSERDDKWAGFQRQRQQLLDFMRDEGLRRTVFLSGDVHVSQWTELKSTSHPEFRVHSIISSAFNAPAISPPQFLFETEGRLDGQADYVLGRHGGYTAVSNFTRLSWKAPVLRVEVFDRKGKRLHETALNLDG